jgi:beta-galactosidase
MHDASPATGYYDVQGMQAEKDLLDAVSEQPFHAEAAILVDYEDLWALQLQPHRAGFTYWRELFTFYRAFQHMGVGVDLAPFDADLSRYRLIVAPVAFIMSAERSEKLRSAVENGATLLLGVRAGFKTPSNKVVDQPLPGLLRDLAGVTVTDWHALPPGVEFPVESNYTSLEVSAGVWAEALRPLSSTDTCVLARYATGPFEGKAAFTQNSLGRGSCFTLGWAPNVDQAQAVLRLLATQAGLRDVTDLPTGLLRIQRGKYTLMLNFTEEPFVVELYGQEKTVQPRNLAVFEKEAYDEL